MKPSSIDNELLDHLTAADGRRSGEFSSALKVAHENDEDLARLLLRLGIIADGEMADALATIVNAPIYDFSHDAELPTSLMKPLSAKFMLDNLVLPVAETQAGVEVVMAFPHDNAAARGLELAFRRPVIKRTATAATIASILAEKLGTDVSDSVGGDELDSDALHTETNINRLRDLSSEAPIVRYVNDLVKRAFEARASDIHIEPFEHYLSVRFRIDGVLQSIDPPRAGSGAAIVSRLKLIAGLDIAEHRLPQDGRFGLHVGGQAIDMRMSTLPTMQGESVVLRLLEKVDGQASFDKLGFRESLVESMQECVSATSGIFLVTGPTGSGKTTTLYGALRQLNTPERKIITVEDPVEYQVDGINQTQVKSRIGLDFAASLRAIVRQDPDVIMIGEMRDLETANIAVRSALTGHLVLSTLHTNDAGSSIVRLVDIGIEPYLVNSTVIGILAQRLIRLLCPACKTTVEMAAENLTDAERAHFPADAAHICHRPGECKQCMRTGYFGRTAVAELLRLTDPVQRLVSAQVDGAAIQHAAKAQGMVTMHTDAMTRVLDGTTSVAEVRRVLTGLQ